MKPSNAEKNDQRPGQHIGKSIDQVQFEDEKATSQKMGDNCAAAVPVSGGSQHKPAKKDLNAHSK